MNRDVATSCVVVHSSSGGLTDDAEAKTGNWLPCPSLSKSGEPQ
jgi:hypothetical protein